MLEIICDVIHLEFFGKMTQYCNTLAHYDSKVDLRIMVLAKHKIKVHVHSVYSCVVSDSCIHSFYIFQQKFDFLDCLKRNFDFRNSSSLMLFIKEAFPSCLYLLLHSLIFVK